MINENTFNAFLEKSLSVVNNKTGLDVSKNSYTREIYKALLLNEEEKIIELERLKEKIDISNLKNENLDLFYGDLFRIPRLTGSNFDILKLYINYNNSNYNYISLKKDGILIYNGVYYYILNDYSLSENNEIEVARCSYIPTISKLINLDEIRIDKNSINFNDDTLNDSDKEFLIQNYLTILNIESLDIESDYEYKIRAGKLIQNYGYINNTKIDNQCKHIENLVRLKWTDKATYTECIVIPENFDNINDTYNAVKEVIDYYKGSDIKLYKPSITMFYLNGLRQQLTNWFIDNVDIINKYIKDINELLSNYFIETYINNINNIKADKIEFIINKYFSDNNILFSLDENNIEITYKIFNRDDYSKEILSGKLLRRGNKEIKTDICVFSGI